MKRWTILLVLSFFITGFVFGQDKDPIYIEAEVQPSEISAGGEGQVIVTCDISSEFHISDTANDLFSVTPESSDKVEFGSIVYPRGEAESYGFVYRGIIQIIIPFTVMKKAEPGENRMPVVVKYQPCLEEGMICYPPDEKKIEARFNILSADSRAGTISSADDMKLEERLNRELEKGSVLAFLLVFLGGLLTSLTPCVYPMIPITMAVIGAQAGGSKLKGFVLSLFYVLGIAITFSALGVIAAKTGGLFGAFSQHPVTLLIIALIFFLMGLSMLGVFIIQMPSSLASKLHGKKGKGFIGALLTGLVAGLIVSPCISPLLVVILAWVAKTGSVMLGIGLLFSFSLGLGVLFILIGTFSGILKTLPKSGGWMELIERGFGILLVALALVFIKPLFSDWVYLGLWGVFFVFFGTFAGAFNPHDKTMDRKKKIGKALGIVTLIIGGSIIFFALAEWRGSGSILQSKESNVSAHEASYWIGTDIEGFSQSLETGKPVLLDFWADWCPACKELDKKTWPDEAVHMELNRFIPVKLDLSRKTEESENLRKKYKVVGMPTVILFDSNGNELTRFSGYKPPEEVVQLLRKY
jgi:thiol:disulfide interchange protein DsbD